MLIRDFIRLISILFLFAYSLPSFSYIQTQKQGNAINNKPYNDSWLKRVKAKLNKREYHINCNEYLGKYQSSNKKNNLRITYHGNGFSIEPETKDEYDRSCNKKSSNGWHSHLKLKAIQHGDKKRLPIQDPVMKAKKNKLISKHKGFHIQYINSEKGMRQNFIVSKKLNSDKSEKLTVKLNYNGSLHPSITKTNTGIIFKESRNGREKLGYKNLKVWDANGKILQAKMKLKEKAKSKIKGDCSSSIQLVVNSQNAEFPLTIDPISVNYDWVDSSNQSNSKYGYSVSTAGDVNNDGYDDVIVGAPEYSNGQSTEGKVFLYRGSSGGLSTSPSWSAEIDQSGAEFGYSVSTAGDINNDGYDDVVIGALNYDATTTDEGGAFIYLGSSTGLSSSSTTALTIGLATARFGNSVSNAGDVNNDGYDDIIVGAKYYEDGNESSEGAAYLFQGSSTGLVSTNVWKTEGNHSYSRYGSDVSTAGDVNNDGYDDIAVG
ncbi:MAG: integrin alpha, partial [Flavobacteriales bacterium]